jgi:hypothetical protein
MISMAHAVNLPREDWSAKTSTGASGELQFTDGMRMLAFDLGQKR